MIQAIYWRNLKQHGLLLTVLFLALVLVEFLLVWVSNQVNIGPEFQAFLEGFLPPEITEMIFSQFGLTTFEGAVAFGYQHPFCLVGAIAMVVVAGTLPAAEREKGYLELFLAHPLPRGRYLWATLLFLATASLVLPGGLLLGSALGLAVVHHPGAAAWPSYLPAALGLSLLLLAIGAYTLMFATGARRRGIAVAQATSFTLLFYWLDFMGDYWDLLVHARRASPFFYFDPNRAAAGTGLSMAEVAVLTGIATVTTFLAFMNFQRQDL